MSVPAPPPSRPTVAPFAAVSFAYFAYAGLVATYGPLWFKSLGYSTFAIGVLTAWTGGALGTGGSRSTPGAA